MNRSTAQLRNASLIAATLLIMAGPMLAMIANGHANWLAPFVAATIISVLSAIGAMTVLGYGLRSPALLPNAAMGATLIRATISLAGGVIAVMQFGMSAPPTLLMILAYYLALLVVECMILFRSVHSVKEL